MTNPPDLTARVDALIYHMSECHTLDNHDQQTVIDMRDTIRALSAERDALKQSLEKAVLACGEQARARGEAEGKLAASEMVGVVDGWKDRAEAAEAARDTLKAGVARLRDALEYIRKPQYGLQGIIEDGDSDEERAAYFSGWCDRYQDRARAALRALEQGE